jgi:hypothetical protein
MRNQFNTICLTGIQQRFKFTCFLSEKQKKKKTQITKAQNRRKISANVSLRYTKGRHVNRLDKSQLNKQIRRKKKEVKDGKAQVAITSATFKHQPGSLLFRSWGKPELLDRLFLHTLIGLGGI